MARHSARGEARINNRGDGGVYFRAAPGLAIWPKGYEAQINASDNTPDKTGSLIAWGGAGTVARVQDSTVRPDQWFNLEIVAIENHILVKVGGHTTVEHIDAERRFPMGHIALEKYHAATVVEFLKIEIKEPESAASRYVANDVQKFFAEDEPAQGQLTTEAGDFFAPGGNDEAAIDQDNTSAAKLPQTARLKKPPTSARPRFAPRDAVLLDEKWYWFSSEKASFEEARQHATRLKGRLVTITSARENAVLAGHLKGPTFMDILKTNGVWLNSTGCRQQYFNWDREHERPSAVEGEIYAAIFRSGLWGDYLPDRLFYCIEWQSGRKSRQSNPQYGAVEK